MNAAYRIEMRSGRLSLDQSLDVLKGYMRYSYVTVIFIALLGDDYMLRCYAMESSLLRFYCCRLWSFFAVY